MASKSKKGKMPAALKAYWASKRGTKSPSASRGSRASSGAQTVAKTKSKSKRGGFARRGAAGLRGFVSKDAMIGVAGGALGLTAANQLAPKIAPRLGAFGQSLAGQLLTKIGLGLVGGIALARVSKSLAGGFAIGAMAEPIAGIVRTQMARQAVAPAGGVRGLMGLAGDEYAYDGSGVYGVGNTSEGYSLPEDVGMEGLAQYDADTAGYSIG